ncbi:MAG: NUDIX domain-containing protein [Patescibacteria group bacterium]
MARDLDTVLLSMKGIVLREDGTLLALRRSKTSPTRPLHWDLPGGQLDTGEDLEAGMTREIKEEAGLEVHDLNLIHAISGLNDIQEFWVVLCYTSRAKNTNVVLSYEHDDFQWVTPQEFLALEPSPSPRQKKFVEKFVSLQKTS